MREWKLTLAALLILTCCFIAACPDSRPAEAPDDDTPAVQQEDTETQSAASNIHIPELLTKRVILYKMAYQEGGLAPFTAHPDVLEGLDLPETGRMFNTFWWDIDFEETSIAPLGAQTMTELEPVIFPYIAVRIDETAEDGRWILMTAGYDSYGIRLPIADLHTEWPQEEREIYLTAQEPECVQVWCVLINEEWKILSHVDCPGAIFPPESPGRPPRETPPVEEEEISEAGE